MFRWIGLGLGVLLLIVFVIIIRNLFSKSIERNANVQDKSLPCKVYYALNIDGMKGLGHTALLLQDETGSMQIFSYNGMQNTLIECLMGKAGIGKMKQFTLDSTAVDKFWKTGDLQAEQFEECDNFDRVAYCAISEKEYETILLGIQQYIAAGDEFERLYAIDIEKAEAFSVGEDIPKYQIYTNNCDTVARKLLALISPEIAGYNDSVRVQTPGYSFKQMCRILGDDWGIMKLGEDSLTENMLSDY